MTRGVGESSGWRIAPVRHGKARSRGGLRSALTTLVAVIVVITVGGLGIVGWTVSQVSNGIHRSAIVLPSSPTAETNILLMGLDSRVDEDGKPFPRSIYQALHAGNSSDGGYNTNVLMLIHIPAGGGRAVGISIPRDDYAAYPGSPYGESHGKIKEAYGLEFADTFDRLVSTGSMSRAAAYQAARGAARREEIATVSAFLGGVPINHFVEVTMAAFYKVALAVQPIEMCVKESTSDPYSNAHFRKGYQELTAETAVEFVRQRRDLNNPALNFTDLDRARRQQAFIIDVLHKLRQTGEITNPVTLQTLFNTAKQDIALDSGFDPLSLAGVAEHFAGGGITFQTLPITGYATINGSDVNTVDLPAIRSQTAHILSASDHPSARHPSTRSSTRPTSTPTRESSATSRPAPSRTANATLDPIQSGSIVCVK
ncbi:LCP family protein [Amnibacterium sp.]|uniref:LCP family protein n=1 Tax=Amnibacterium sp. TaxID=1872496 RepID=UPI003F7BD21B